MKYKTSITNIKEDGKEYIRGIDLTILIKNNSFVESIFLILRGRMPEEKETQMLNAMFTAAIDNGPGSASGQVSRIVASAKNSMHTSLAAGILGMGERHGSAIEPAMEFFYKHADEKDVEGLVKGLKEKKIRVSGYGHAVLDHDHRADALFESAKQIGFYGKHCKFANEVHTELNKISSKKLPINIDGAMGSILCDMGFDSRMSKGIFIIARMPGLVAHVYEEMVNDIGLRRLSQDDVEYIGK